MSVWNIKSGLHASAEVKPTNFYKILQPQKFSPQIIWVHMVTKTFRDHMIIMWHYNEATKVILCQSQDLQGSPVYHVTTVMWPLSCDHCHVTTVMWPLSQVYQQSTKSCCFNQQQRSHGYHMTTTRAYMQVSHNKLHLVYTVTCNM